MVVSVAKTYPAQTDRTRGPSPILPKPVARTSSDALVVPRSSRSAQFMWVASIAAIVCGFIIKKQEIFVPGEGIGYQLGIAGGVTMLLLLFYPLVKRSKIFGRGASSAFWFKWHMVLGVIGPILIFYHANFSMGATNSNIALFALILVAASGVVGRYIYVNVHNGMYGAKLDVGSLLAKATRLMTGIEGDVGGANGKLAKSLSDFGEVAFPKSSRIIPNILNTMALPFRRSAAKSRIMNEVRKAVRANAQLHKWSRGAERVQVQNAKMHVNEFLNAVSRAAQLTLWERMFSLWHVFHVPLFFLLLVSGVIHVVAVHLY